MAGSPKYFAEKLNECLDESEAPAQARERANILSKLLDIPKQQARSILDGHQLPEDGLLERIAEEFEVDRKWLCGE